MLGYSIPKIPLSLLGKYDNQKRIKYLEWKTGSICQDIVKGKKDLMKYGHQVKASIENIRYADDEKKCKIADYIDCLDDIIIDYKESKELYEIDLEMKMDVQRYLI